MADKLGYPKIAAMLDAAAGEVISHEGLLSELDSVAGDGDHGTTMCRAARAIQLVAHQPGSDLATLFMQTGDALLANDGGASGGLLGAFFLAIADGCKDKAALNTNDLAAAFQSGLAGMKKYTTARVGDKTMLDALEPAVQALADAAAHGEEAEIALQTAAQAAATGAAETKNMQAKLGRARHLGARTLGYQDPGATTIACLFQGFAHGILKL